MVLAQSSVPSSRGQGCAQEHRLQKGSCHFSLKKEEDGVNFYRCSSDFRSADLIGRPVSRSRAPYGTTEEQIWVNPDSSHAVRTVYNCV